MSAPPGDYLKYLPAIYAAPPDPFLGQFLSIFQKILTGLDDDQLQGRKGIQDLLAATVVGNLFYPRFSFLFPGDTTPIPPISGLAPQQQAAVLDQFNSYIGIAAPAVPVGAPAGPKPDPRAPFLAWLDGLLVWLGGWIGLVIDTDWSIDKKRTVIAQMPALYRARGTAQGLSWLINLWFDLPLTITGVSYDAQGNPSPVTGQISVTVAAPVTPGITLTAQAGQKGTFILRDDARPGQPIVSGYAPWLFDIVMTLPNAARPDFILTAQNAAQIRALRSQLATLLDRVRPAGSSYRMTLVPGMRLQADGRAAQLGINTFLGAGSTT